MASSTRNLSSKMQKWLNAHGCRPSAALQNLRTSTMELEDAEMLTSPEQLQFLALLATSIGATNAIDVGVYTGASALAIAEVLPDDGQVVACDLTDEHLGLATHSWSEGGVMNRIDMRIGPAIETLQTLVDENFAGTFDFMYIDADKINSRNYYELGLRLLRSGGIIAIDNMFYGGQVADPSCDDESTLATRALASFLVADERVDYALVPIGDGLAIARVRNQG